MLHCHRLSFKALGILLLALACLLPGFVQAQATKVTTVTYIYTNAQGSPLAKADEQGNIIARYTYRPYGTQQSGPTNKGPGYTGHVNDPATGLVYMQQRYYDPALGRFLSPDPVAPSPGNVFNFGRFTYANDNPVRNVDPDGKECRAATKTSPGGCWNTPEERRLAHEGKWKAYYKLAGGKGHDPYAQRAGNVASNSGKGYEGILDVVTNKILEVSIAKNLPALPTIVATKVVAVSMENIRIDLVKARVNLLDQKGATEQNPVKMTKQEAANFHQKVFHENGAGNVFGGRIYDSVLRSPGKALYNWCPEPSCEQ